MNSADVKAAAKGFRIGLFDKNEKALDVLGNSKDSEKFLTFEEDIDLEGRNRYRDESDTPVIKCPTNL